MWNGHKPSLNHIRIWGAPTHVLRKEPHKSESRTEVCLFIEYPKGMRGGLFYSFSENKVIVSTNAKFFKEDYVNNFKPKSKVILEEIDSAQESPKPPKFGPIVPKVENIGFDRYIGTWILRIYRIYRRYISGYFYMNIDIS